MSVHAELHTRDGFEADPGHVFEAQPDMKAFATICLREKGDHASHITLYFHRSEDIAALVDRLGDLFQRFRVAESALDDAVLIGADPIPGEPITDELPLDAQQVYERELACGVPPWPVKPGTDTTGWTMSQQLGEQPPPKIRGECERCKLTCDDLRGGICGSCGDDLREEAEADKAVAAHDAKPTSGEINTDEF